jgi:amino acid transporter
MAPLRREIALVVAAVRGYPLLSALFAALALLVIGFGLLVGGVQMFGFYAFLVFVISLAVLRWRWGRVGPESRAERRRAALVTAVLAGLGVFALIQLVPYGRAHANPPVSGEPQWASP